MKGQTMIAVGASALVFVGWRTIGVEPALLILTYLVGAGFIGAGIAKLVVR